MEEEPTEAVRAERIAMFREIAGEEMDLDTCSALLASNDWNVESTIRNLFDGPHPKPDAHASASATSTSPSDSDSATAKFIEHLMMADEAELQRNGHSSSSFNEFRERELFGRRDSSSDEQASFLDRTSRVRRRGVSPDRPDSSNGFFNPTRLTRTPPSSAPTPPFSFVGKLKEFITGQSQETAASAARRFATEFDRIVGPQHSTPEFFESSFEDALLSASTERRMLACYLHSPLHPDSELFCKDIICSRQVLQALNDVRVWGGSIENSEGYLASSKVLAAAFPCLILISTDRTGGRDARVIDRIYLDDPNEVNVADKVAARIASAKIARFTQQGAYIPPQEAERVNERRRVVQEQDAALQSSLEADRKKLEEKRLREQQEEQERIRKREEEDKYNRELNLKRQRIQPEPEKILDISTIRFQFPGGQKLQRRFLSNDTIGYIRDFLDVHLADNTETPRLRYALFSSYPKREFNDISQTLKEAGLCPQGVLMLQDLDA